MPSWPSERHQLMRKNGTDRASFLVSLVQPKIRVLQIFQLIDSCRTCLVAAVTDALVCCLCLWDLVLQGSW